MILFRLACDCGHEFEAWFQSGRAFDTLAAKGQLACPACGGSKVHKAVMAPRISKAIPAPSTHVTDAADTAEKASAPMATVHAEFVAAIRRLREDVKDQADYVGPRFADEARKIDAGDAPDRGIYGEATASEARSLLEDGIAILPLPRLPEDNN